MALTQAQITTARSAILLDATAMAFVNAPGAPDVTGMRNYLNGPSTFIVWRNQTPLADIHDAITWANYTPRNVDLVATVAGTNWLTQCGLKQMNLQNILSAAAALFGYINTGKQNIRTGLEDALTGIPSGANGAPVNGGWPAVRAAIQRPATLFEKIFATGAGTAGANAGSLVYEGAFDEVDSVNVVFNQDGTRAI